MFSFVFYKRFSIVIDIYLYSIYSFNTHYSVMYVFFLFVNLSKGFVVLNLKIYTM